jgi:hypothetical protein
MPLTLHCYNSVCFLVLYQGELGDRDQRPGCSSRDEGAADRGQRGEVAGVGA